MATIRDIADAVVTAINGHAFAKSFTAAFKYSPTFDVRDLDVLTVSVVPRALSMTTIARTLNQDEIQLDIGIQQKVGTPAGSDVDGLMALVQEIAEFIRETKNFDEAVWVSSENAPIYSPEHLEEKRLFTSVLTLTLRKASA